MDEKLLTKNAQFILHSLMTTCTSIIMHGAARLLDGYLQ